MKPEDNKTTEIKSTQEQTKVANKEVKVKDTKEITLEEMKTETEKINKQIDEIKIKSEYEKAKSTLAELTEKNQPKNEKIAGVNETKLAKENLENADFNDDSWIDEVAKKNNLIKE